MDREAVVGSLTALVAVAARPVGVLAAVLVGVEAAVVSLIERFPAVS